ncbi:MAG: CPBP family intramembrane metalloprotease [Thermoplasmata archaeon]|nr:CPBP family intramembrane metalloprotease [Thermoplasmata archaeon]
MDQMRCSRCGVDFQGAFCPNCGTSAQDSIAPTETRCPRCGQLVYGSYCTHCGLPKSPPQVVYQYPYPVQRRQTNELGKIVSISWIIYFAIFLSGVVVFLGLLWWGVSIVVPGILEDSCADCKAVLLIITPLPIPIVEPFGGIPFLIYYMIVVAVISSCFFWLLFRDMPQVIADFKEALKKGWFSSRSKSTLLLIGQLFAFGVFFNVGYNLIILILFGEGALPAGTELDPPWYFLSMVAAAAVWEELIARTLLIGVPLFIIALLKRQDIKRPSRFFIGGGFTIGRFELAFLVFSAVMFGLAHTFSGGPWVFPPLFVGGMILGYLFLKKGIVASILFHFIWNYSIAFTNIASIYGNLVLMGLGLAFTLFVAFVGLFFTLSYIIKTLRKSQAQAKTTQQAQRGFQTPTQTGYQCPRCGYTSAIYKDGRFQCLQCEYITQP